MSISRPSHDLGKIEVRKISGPLDGKVIGLNRTIHPRERDEIEIRLTEWVIKDLKDQMGDCKGCANAIIRTERGHSGDDYSDVIMGRAKCKTGTCSMYHTDGGLVDAMKYAYDKSELTSREEREAFRDRVMREVLAMSATLAEPSAIPDDTAIINDDSSDGGMDALRFATTSLTSSSNDRPTSAAAGSW
jgi:hypothetical protein